MKAIQTSKNLVLIDIVHKEIAQSCLAIHLESKCTSSINSYRKMISTNSSSFINRMSKNLSLRLKKEKRSIFMKSLGRILQIKRKGRREPRKRRRIEERHQ